jgi:hypothetical protein
MMTMRSRAIGAEAPVSHTDIASDVADCVDLPFYFISRPFSLVILQHA